MTFFNIGDKMKNKPLDVTIPNWTMFGAKRISINLFEKEIEGNILYTSALLIWLDDGLPEEEYEEKTVTLFTDVVTDDPKKSGMILGEYASSIFDNIDSVVYVFNGDNDIIDQFDLNEIAEEEMPEINLEDFGMVETHKKVIH